MLIAASPALTPIKGNTAARELFPSGNQRVRVGKLSTRNFTLDMTLNTGQLSQSINNKFPIVIHNLPANIKKLLILN